MGKVTEVVGEIRRLSVWVKVLRRRNRLASCVLAPWRRPHGREYTTRATPYYFPLNVYMDKK